MPARPNTRAVGEPDRGSFPFGAPPCRIVQHAPSVVLGNRWRRGWELVFEPQSRRAIEPLMGWTATNNPFAQIRLRFLTLAAAVAYAERQGLDYAVVEPPARRPGSKGREPILMPGMAVAAQTTGYPYRLGTPGDANLRRCR